MLFIQNTVEVCLLFSSREPHELFFEPSQEQTPHGFVGAAYFALLPVPPGMGSVLSFPLFTRDMLIR